MRILNWIYDKIIGIEDIPLMTAEEFFTMPLRDTLPAYPLRIEESITRINSTCELDESEEADIDKVVIIEGPYDPRDYDT